MIIGIEIAIGITFVFWLKQVVSEVLSVVVYG